MTDSTRQSLKAVPISPEAIHARMGQATFADAVACVMAWEDSDQLAGDLVIALWDLFERR